MNTLATGSFDGISTHISMADSAGMAATSTDVHLHAPCEVLRTSLKIV
jgi:hypothetical protein